VRCSRVVDLTNPKAFMVLGKLLYAQNCDIDCTKLQNVSKFGYWGFFLKVSQPSRHSTWKNYKLKDPLSRLVLEPITVHIYSNILQAVDSTDSRGKHTSNRAAFCLQEFQREAVDSVESHLHLVQVQALHNYKSLHTRAWVLSGANFA
jgi:hypothetical protein